MYIKQIIIQGFKSYKDQTVIEPFSPGVNVVVGRNGSGKSNFFAAIRFVLSDAYSKMGREERQGLLHEGSGSAVMSGYVEVIFDNKDGRFPTGSDEVVIRRTIRPNKDEYSLDKKVVQNRDEVNSLLEAAGFSKSNPYYIVPQGRIAHLTNMRESERLNLLKVVAGTQQYQDKRSESLKIMGDTQNKIEKVDEQLVYIKERLDELEGDKEELRAYQSKDRERRCLEYAHYHKLQAAVQEALEELNQSRQDGLEDTDEQREVYGKLEKEVVNLDATIHESNQQLQLLRLDQKQLEDDRRDSAKAKAKAELTVKTLSEGMSSQEQAREHLESELDGVKASIATKERELAEVMPQYEKKKQEESETRAELDAAEVARERLFSKQAHSSQFRNKTERDTWLRKEIADYRKALDQQKSNRTDVAEGVDEIAASIKRLEKELSELREQNESFGDKRSEQKEAVAKAEKTVEEHSDERKLLRREADRLQTILKNGMQERDLADRALSHTMDGETSRGLATLRRLRRERDIPGAYGTMAELLEVPENYRLPVEVVAGASLFHYIVDNEETATELGKLLHKQRGGRLTFAPLSKIRVRNLNLPRATDAVALLSKIKYDSKYEAAFSLVFGKTIVCPNLTVASQYARSHGVDGVTLDGDMTNKRGAMTGGYIDRGKSRLAAVATVNKWRDECENVERELRRVEKQIDRKDQEINLAMSEHQKLAHKLHQMLNGYGSLLEEINAKNIQIEEEQSHLEAARRRLDQVDRNIKDFGDKISAHEAELASDFKKALTNEEESQLEELGVSIPPLQKKWNDVCSARRKHESSKQILKGELRTLRLKLDQLLGQVVETASNGGSDALQDAQRELNKAQKALSTVEGRLEKTHTDIEAVESNMKGREKEKQQKEAELQEIATEIKKQEKKLEKGIQNKALLTANDVEYAKRIRELGVLPDEAFDKYERLEPKTISSRIKKVNEALKKYKHINKKAFEQYQTFTNYQDQLLKRRNELEQSREAIETLVNHLDQRKDEAIERTFKQVSKDFATIFEKLVPAGHGRLVIQRKADRRVDPEETDEETRGTVENYTGVGISVSFNSKVLDEQQRIQQLSGGQKSLCALCLIFALQRTESSPMVIFDEVDANLDAQYRTAVATLLDDISKNEGTQFICTTFRPEMLHVADKCYGVLFRNKNSRIDVVSVDQALDFVEGQAPK